MENRVIQHGLITVRSYRPITPGVLQSTSLSHLSREIVQALMPLFRLANLKCSANVVLPLLEKPPIKTISPQLNSDASESQKN